MCVCTRVEGRVLGRLKYPYYFTAYESQDKVTLMLCYVIIYLHESFFDVYTLITLCSRDNAEGQRTTHASIHLSFAACAI